MVSPEKQAALESRMAKLGILEADLTEKFILGSGSGGQKINKTHSCVYIKHEPSGIEIKNQSSRSREMNRYAARRDLCDAFDEIRLGKASKRQQEMEKVRRQKRRRSRRSKQRSVADKRILSNKKNLRRSPGRDD
ncbi:peptide chain release factor family protein [Haloferula chungangensis]|uniref:Peptide chain release factor family protein n=1 Tax=Haloferula chungangensis TaxID=1048331 RepID=A0ABW2L731_9BACT